MTTPRLSSTLLVLLLVGSGPAHAVRLTDQPAPSPATVRSATSAAAGTPVDDSSSMREGVINAVGPQHDQIEINGSWLKLPEGNVFRDGAAAPRGSLVKGERVRFILVPGDDRTVLRAVYVP